MFPSGTEVLRVKTILGGLDDTEPGTLLSGTINDNVDRNWQFDANFDNTPPLVLRSRQDVPPGIYKFRIRVFYFDIFAGEEFSALLRDVEIQVLPKTG